MEDSTPHPQKRPRRSRSTAAGGVDQTPRVVKEPTLLDVFAIFIMHAGVVSGQKHVYPDDVYDLAEALLIESERRHGTR